MPVKISDEDFIAVFRKLGSPQRVSEELGLNVFYGGHYATETFGVKALAAHLSRKFSVPWTFLDHPTGL